MNEKLKLLLLRKSPLSIDLSKVDEELKGTKEYKNAVIEQEIKRLEEWFINYDNQVKQYERSLRLNEQISLAIEGENFKSINDLDLKAREYQLRIRELREKIKR